MPQAFEKAVWIWRNAPAGRDEFCDFLTTFTAGADTACRLRIAADSNYSVWINGQLAAFGQYADYPDYKVYDEVDVTACTHPGENRMAITVWHYGVASQTYAPGEAGLIFELADADGNILRVSKDILRHRHAVPPVPRLYLRKMRSDLLPARTYLPL